MKELILQVAERLMLPVTVIEHWRHIRAISIRKISGGWRLKLKHEPAISVVTAAWERCRKKKGYLWPDMFLAV